jgi:hypothetical protein
VPLDLTPQSMLAFATRLGNSLYRDNKKKLQATPSPRALGSVARLFALWWVGLIAIGGFALERAGAEEVLTQHNDNRRTGANLHETKLKVFNVNDSVFGKLGIYPVQGQIHGQPLYAEQVPVPGSDVRRNVVYVATQHNLIYAFNADADPAVPASWDPLPGWPYDAGQSATVPVRDVYRNKDDNITPEIGISSTPVIDRHSGTLYAVAMTKEGGRYVQRLHAVDISTGQPKNGMAPVMIDGHRFSALHQLQRAALTLANDLVYIAWSSFGDQDPWYGFVMSYAAIGSPKAMQKMEQFIVADRDPLIGFSKSKGGIWQSGSGLAVDDEGFLYAVTGNGDSGRSQTLKNTPENAGEDFDASTIKLSPKLSVVDYYTPSYRNFLNDNDLDLGVGGPMIPPDKPDASGNLVKRVLHGSKAGLLYVLNREGLGGYHSTSNNTVQEVLVYSVKGGFGKDTDYNHMHLHATPVFWSGPTEDRVYAISETPHVIKAYRYSGGKLDIVPVAQSNIFAAATQMSLSSFGSDRGAGVLWIISPGGDPEGNALKLSCAMKPQVKADKDQHVCGVLQAFDAQNLTEIYSSERRPWRDRVGAYARFGVPTISNGRVFVPTFSDELVVFGSIPCDAMCKRDVSIEP